MNDTQQGFSFFWGGRFALDAVEEIDQDDTRRTIEWLLHDYHTSAEGKRIIELFLETQASGYPPEARAILDAWAGSALGIFRMIELDNQNALHLLDLLRQEELTVRDVMLARNARPGDLLIGRLYALQDVNRLSMMTFLLPPDYEPGLVQYVTNAHDLYQDEHPGATWDTFLRENGHIFNAYLLSPRAEALRSLIGPGTRYHDPVPSRDRLHQHTRERLREQREQQQASQVERRGPEVHRTNTGIILPGAEPETRPAEAAEESPSKPTILIPGRDF